MTIELRDASLQARIRKQLQATGSSSVEEVLFRLLEIASPLSSLAKPLLREGEAAAQPKDPIHVCSHTSVWPVTPPEPRAAREA